MAATRYDAVVVGAGPNGLAAAITLARAGRSVVVYEAQPTVGGGMRTAELTLPGFHHDICSAIHPLGVGSPFMRSLPLERFGLEWIFPPAALAHPFDDGTAITLERSVEATAAQLGRDATAYRRLMTPLVNDWQVLTEAILGPLTFPRHPVALARFGLSAMLPAAVLVTTHFREAHTRAFFAGMAAHAMVPLGRPATAAFGLVLAMLGHGVGWPVARGGSQQIANAMVAYLRTLGGEVVTDTRITSLAELPPSNVILCDVAPRQLVQLARDQWPASYQRRLQRYRYGPGAFKMDFALRGPIPWQAAACTRAATVHLGGSLGEIAACESAAWQGRTVQHPYVLVAQQSLFDASRAPEGQHTAWAYCHLPNGSTEDMADRIEAQIERFAPGFRALVLARHIMTPADFAHYNPNYVGGDINGGAQDLAQLFTRPIAQINPYATPLPHVLLCSASTPPGGGVHGMCGEHAAQAVLRRMI